MILSFLGFLSLWKHLKSMRLHAEIARQKAIIFEKHIIDDFAPLQMKKKHEIAVSTNQNKVTTNEKYSTGMISLSCFFIYHLSFPQFANKRHPRSPRCFAGFMTYYRFKTNCSPLRSCNPPYEMSGFNNYFLNHRLIFKNLRTVDYWRGCLSNLLRIGSQLNFHS